MNDLTFNLADIYSCRMIHDCCMHTYEVLFYYNIYVYFNINP